MLVNNNELRLGNLVTQKGSDFVETVDFEIFERLSKNTIVLDGIPFQKDFLKDVFGFKDGIDEMEFCSDYLCMYWKKFENYIEINGEKYFIKYVHQLQNLYFALTGAELINNEL